jgi:ATP synthase protein I
MNEHRSAKDAASDTEPSSANGITLVSYLLGGLAFWGGVGWVADRLLGLPALFLPIGLGLGFAGSIYLIYTQHVRS